MSHVRGSLWLECVRSSYPRVGLLGDRYRRSRSGNGPALRPGVRRGNMSIIPHKSLAPGPERLMSAICDRATMATAVVLGNLRSCAEKLLRNIENGCRPLLRGHCPWRGTCTCRTWRAWTGALGVFEACSDCGFHLRVRWEDDWTGLAGRNGGWWVEKNEDMPAL